MSAISLLWIALLSGFVGGDEAVMSTADRLEINHVYALDDTVKPGIVLRFSQLIWWKFHACEQRFVVVDWRMLKREQPEVVAGAWVVRWSSKGRLVGIRAKVAVETWTLDDPEQVDRGKYGTVYRWGLGNR